MASLTVTIIALIWKYSNLFLTVLLPTALLVLYKLSVFSTLISYRYTIGYCCLISTVPSYAIWRWYVFYIRGGNRKSDSKKSLKGKTIIITGRQSQFVIYVIMIDSAGMHVFACDYTVFGVHQDHR